MKKLLKIKELSKKVINKLKNKNVSIKFLFLDLALLLIIITMVFNIFIAYRDGAENLGKLRIEEEKLSKLINESERLTEEENYYRSIEFRKAYARDSLNLSQEGETLYLVVRDEDEPQDENTAQKLFDPNSIPKSNQWKLLILGL